MKFNVLRVATLVLVIPVLVSCSQPAVEEHEQKEGDHEVHVALPTMRVTTETVKHSVDVPGKISALPDHSVMVSPNFAGKLTRVVVVPGQRVGKGQVVAQLDEQQLIAQLQQATAPEKAAASQVKQARIALDLAQKNYERLKALEEKDVVAQKDVIAAQSQVESAKAQVEAAQAKLGEAKVAPAFVTTQLNFAKVRTPISGVVAQRFLNAGDPADPSKPIVHVVDLQEVIINADMPADSPVHPAVGQFAVVSPVSEPLLQYRAQIVSVSPVVNLQSNTVNIRLRCVNTGLQLKEGQTVSVSIGLAEMRNVVTIPKSALVAGIEDPSEQNVYVVRGGKLQRTRVTIGPETHGRVAVTQGLTEGDEIVTSGAYGQPEGAILDRTGKGAASSDK